jgi:hypothetical protein
VKRIVLITLVVMLTAASSAWAFWVKDVIDMHKAGVADSLIIQKIVYSGIRFTLSGADVKKLKEAGVSDAVISEMLRTESAGENGGNGGNGEGAHPYAAPYGYGPYYAPYWGPGLALSFGFGYGYYGHYPYYAPYGYYPYGYHPYAYHAPYVYHYHGPAYGYGHPFGYHGPNRYSHR